MKAINVMDFRPAAREALPPGAWSYLSSGAEDEDTLAENRRAFRRLRFVPRVLRDVSSVELGTAVLGQEIAFPVLAAPAGFQGLFHPDAELATARAVADHGTLMVLSTLSSRPLEDVASVGPKRWFQLYAYRDREITAALVRRAEEAGYGAICLTVDTPRLGRREDDVRHRVEIPPDAMPANFEGLVDVPEGEARGGSAVAYLARELLDPSLDWEDLAWLVELTDLPVAVKGVVAPDDAVRAVEAGAEAVVVSNHGGRQLDDTVASIAALEAVAEAVDGRAQVLLDGGIRRGRDVVKALALGARAVLVGRPYLWGLAADGEEGVRRGLAMLRDEVEAAAALAGCPSTDGVPRNRVQWRPGARAAGA